MFTRRTFTTSLATAAAASLFSTASKPQSVPRVRNVVLVHGAYADGSSWFDVIGRLQSVGLRATAVQNPLSSLADDVAATRSILQLQDGPTVLVGHSFAGTIISETGVDPKVASLVYVAARAPDAGEDYAALAAKFPRPPASDGLVTAGGFAQLNEETFLKYFAGDVTPSRRASCTRFRAASPPRSLRRGPPLRPGGVSLAGIRSPRTTKRSHPSSNASWRIA